MNDMQELEDKIVAQYELRRSQGWTIAQGRTIDIENKCCCALGAFYEPGETQSLGSLARVANVERAGAFATGFDDLELPIQLRSYEQDRYHDRVRSYELGRRVARRLGLIR